VLRSNIIFCDNLLFALSEKLQYWLAASVCKHQWSVDTSNIHFLRVLKHQNWMQLVYHCKWWLGSEHVLQYITYSPTGPSHGDCGPVCCTALAGPVAPVAPVYPAWPVWPEVIVVVVVYWQKCGQRNRDTTRIAVKNKT